MTDPHMTDLLLAGDDHHEIISEPATVWVNDATGCCIGRFSRRGIDVHRTGPEQLAHGTQCLDCIAIGPELDAASAWIRFVAAMKTHHGVDIGAEHRPDFTRPA